MQKKTIVTVIPAYNEGITIGSVVLGSLKYSREVIVVDDGSADDTAEIARLAGATVIEHINNQGKAQAIKTGFKAAQDMGAEAVVMIDADGQHNPDEIPIVAAPILSDEADLVIGSRFIGEGNDIPAYRQIGQKTLNYATNVSSASGNGKSKGTGNGNENGNNTDGVPAPDSPSASVNKTYKSTDSQSGFRALGPRALSNCKFTSNGYSLETDMITHMVSHGMRITEVPISVRYEVPHKHKKNPVSHGFDIMSDIVGVIGYKRPLLFFGIPGSILALSGCGVGLYIFSELYRNGTFHYTMAIISVAALILGLMLITSGLILNSLVQIMRGYSGDGGNI
ncbi:glycosyltransferase family 2 protein [Methanogenium sp. S4BF]|uniref:glycosyltransferase family 2 protein n=1 Tax=Methanogenium sp. S4BF TaxID=1789226 RepID=UPI0024159C60|nr:glycosyltransferase family 2 protein [Methanogenium sp. S4BF]WFN35020.1 glycosyltransferase family 2 protein [Methanogenium sp. S4BF]